MMDPGLQFDNSIDPAEQPQRRARATLPVPDFGVLFQTIPGAHLVLLTDDPVFTVVAVSDDHLKIGGIKRETVVGRGIFEVFPDPALPSSARELADSLRRVIAGCAADQMPVQRYDIRAPGSDQFEERYWTSLNKPVPGPDGAVEFVLHTATEVTEQVLRERSRQQQSEQARKQVDRANRSNAQILESITDGFLTLDREWRFVYVNPAAERMMGAVREELLGKSHWEAFPGALGTVGEREYRRAVREKVPVEFELFYEPWNLWFAVKAYPTPEGGLSAYFKDVTESKRVHERLRESEERFTKAFAEAPIGMVITTPEGRIDEVNQAYLDMLGYTREELTSRDSTHFTHPDDIAATRQFYASLKQSSRTSATIEKRYIRKSGELLWARASATMRCDDQGRPTQLIAIIEDITQRKRAEEQLRESQQRLRAIYDGTYEYIGLLAPDGTLLEANRASLEFAGNTREEVIGRRFWDTPWFTHTPEAPAPAREGVARAATGEFVRYEATLRRPASAFSKGEIATFDISLHPVRNERGEVVLIVPEGRDITERKAMETRDAFLVGLDDAIRPLTGLHEITRTVGRLLGQHLQVDHCAWADVEAEGNTLNLTGSYSYGVAGDAGRYSFEQFGQECARLMSEGKPSSVLDIETDPRLSSVVDFYRRSHIRSILCMPLLKAGRLVAAMTVHQTTPREWRQHEIELLHLVAGRCWESIERARVARELRASEQRLRLAQRAGRIGSFEWDIKASRVLWSQELEALYGVPGGTFEGSLEYWSQRLVPEDAVRVIAEFESCMALRQTECAWEFRAVLPSGAFRWLRGQGQFFYDDTGAAERMVGVNIDIDARKQAEAGLRQQWQTFDTALSHIPDFAYIFDLEGRFTYVNRSLLSLWQMPLEAAVGKNFLELGYPPELAGRLQRQIQEVIDIRQPVRDQTPFTGPTGETRHYEYIFVPVTATDGQIEAVAGSTRDVTERNRGAELIEQDRRRWRDLLLQAPAAIAVLRGPELKYEWINSDYERLVGRPAVALVGKPVLEAIPEIAGQGYGDVLDGVYGTGESHSAHEAVVWLGEGVLRKLYINFVFMATRDSSGGIDGIFVHALDVTDVVNVRIQVEESEARYRFLAESIPQMVWTATPDGALDYVSGQVASYFGMTVETLLGAGWLAGVHPDDQAGVLERWQQSLATGEPYEAGFRLRRGEDAAWRWFLVRARSMPAPEGKVLRWVGTCTDIHDQKESEAALRRVNRELEEFAYVASHDLQEPLRMVSIYTQLILKQIGQNNQGGDDATLSLYTGFVQQGTRRMEALIRDLLTFSRTVHTDELSIGVADLSESLREALNVLRNRIEESGAAVTSQILPRVRGETAQMAHVFQNVVSNALKYRRNDLAPRIHISAESEGNDWVVSIRDNGIGFEQQYAERIFGLFKRLHKDEYPGTGLGLAICKRIVERYGGRMWAEGKPGEGATFRFTLPRMEDR